MNRTHLYRFGPKTVSTISPLQSPCPSRSWCRGLCLWSCGLSTISTSVLCRWHSTYCDYVRLAQVWHSIVRFFLLSSTLRFSFAALCTTNFSRFWFFWRAFSYTLVVHKYHLRICSARCSKLSTLFWNLLKLETWNQRQRLPPWNPLKPPETSWNLPLSNICG